MAKYICPMCGNTSFEVNAKVLQTWRFDEHGDCQEVLNDYREVFHWPDDGDAWKCDKCGFTDLGINFLGGVETEAVECCPECEGENVFEDYDAKQDGYKVHCQHCGEEMMLCDECLHADDNLGQYCDWHGVKVLTGEYGVCFRGVTFKKKKG